MGLVNSHLRPDTHLTPKKAFSDDNVFKNERKKKKNKNKKIEGNNHKNNLDVNNYKNDNERKEENRNNKNEKNNNINDNKEKNHQNKNEKNHPKLQNPFYTPQISRQQNDCQQEKHQQLNISSSISQQNQHNNVVYRRKQTSNVNIPNYYHANNIDQNYPHRSNNNNINNINNNNERNNSNNNNNKNNNNENFSNEVSSPLSLIISHELNRDIFQFIKQPANNKNNDAKNNSKNTNNCSHIFQKLEKQKNEKNGNKNSNKQNGIQSSSAKRIAKDESRQEDLVLLHKLIRKTNTHDYKEVCNMVRSSSCYYIADFLESLERLATLDRESLTSPSTNFINDIGSVKNGGSLQHEDNKGFMKDYDLIRSDGVSTGGINIDGKNTLGNESKLCASAQKSQNVDYECPGAVTKHSANYSPACNDIKQDVNSSQYSFDFTSHRKIPNGAKGPSSCIILPSPHPFPQSPFSPPTLLVSQNTIGHHFNPPFMISAQADEDTLDSGNINKNDVRTVHKTSCGLCDERGLLEMVEEHKNRIKDEINSKQDIFQKKLVNGPVSNKPANNTFPKNKCNQIYSNNKKTNTNNKYNNNNNKNNNNNNRNNNENINNTEDNYNDKNNTEDINEGKNNDNIVIDFFYIDKETKRKVNSIAQVIEMKKNKYCWKEGVIDGRDDRKLRDSGFNADEHELFNKNYRKKNPMYERYLLNINKESQGNNVFNTNSHLSINNNNINIYNNNSSTNICNINSDQNNKQTLTPRCPRDIIFNTTNKIQRPISLCVIPDTSDRFIPACALSMRHKCLCEKQSRRLCHVMEGRECCVVEVFIESCKVSVSSAMLLGKTFLYNDSLKVLKMTSCCLEDDHVMGLSQGICKNASLGCVDLSWNKITSRGVVYLCGALKKNKSVWSVVLDGNHLSDAGAESFAKLLKSSKISKTDKENVNDENDDECGYRKNIPQTRGSLKEWGNFCSLKSLSLKDNKISIRGTTSILKALKSNMYLSDLNLSGNFVHSTAMQHLADSLLTNRSLKLLRLDNCHVTDSGCKSLTRALKTNLDLNFLSLDCNCITDEGVESISEALKLNRGLRELSLNFCKVSEVGLDMLVSSVRFNSKLRCIMLCFNNINFHQDLTNNSLSNLELSYRNDNFQNFEKNFRKKEIELKELNALEALEGCLKEEDLQWVDGRNHAKLNEKVTFFRHKSFKQRLFMALKRNPSFRIII